MTVLIISGFIHISHDTLADDDEITIDELIETAKEQVDELKSFYKESETTLTTGENSTVLTVKEWMKQDNDNTKLRYEIHHDDEDIDIIVGDDDYALSYNALEELAHEYYREPDSDSVNGFEDANAISVIESALESYDVTIDGIVELLDRETYHLIFEHKDSGINDSKFEVWVDTEYFVILKQHEIGERHEFKLEVIAFETNENFDDDMFELDIPDDVEMITSGTPPEEDE